jgi:tetratricopeptide (TPR) repeat protein
MRRNAVKWWAAAFISGAAIFCFSLARPAYDELEAELLAAQQASPADALNLAQTLIQDYPTQCVPYQIAANVYTLEKDYAAAESVLQSAIEKCAAPPELYVRLAHFYQRVMPEESDQKIAAIINRPEVDNSPLLAAKLLCIGGRRSQAIQSLEKVPRTFDTTLMLSRLYTEENEHDQAGRMLMEIRDFHGLDRAQKIRLLAALVALPAPLDRDQTGFCLDLILETAAPETSYTACRRHLSENLDKLISRDTDGHTAALLQTSLGQADLTDMWVWLGVIYLQKIQKSRVAYALLKGYETDDACVLEEKARLAVHTAEKNEIRESWQRLLTIKPKDIRIRLTYAQMLNQADLITESRNILAGIEQDNIPEALGWSYYSLGLDNDAALEDYDALVDKWVQAGQIYGYDDFLLIKDIIFSRLPETAQHRRLLAALEAKISAGLPQSAAADLLHMFIAEQLRDTDLYFASADAFLSGQATCNAQTISTFVQDAINTALSSSPPGQAAATEKPNPSQAMQFAVKWSAYLVEQYPDNPAYKIDLIFSDFISGRTSDLEERCDNMLKGNEDNHRQLEMVARMLFRIGRYRLSADYYQKAMDLRPDILRYQLGHADCLVRLHKYQQARKIYSRMLTHPTTVRTWDVKTLLGRLWLCFEEPGNAAEFIRLIETLKTHATLDANELRDAAGTLLLEKGRFQDAEKQLTEYIQNAPENEQQYGTRLKLATCYALQANYDAAIRLYTECLHQYPGDNLKVVDCLYNRAEMKRRKGDYQAAIEDWKAIAERFPADEVAAQGLLAAAAVACDVLQDLPQARQLYKTCLKLAKPHSPIIRIVEEKLAAMDTPG